MAWFQGQPAKTGALVSKQWSSFLNILEDIIQNKSQKYSQTRSDTNHHQQQEGGQLKYTLISDYSSQRMNAARF